MIKPAGRPRGERRGHGRAHWYSPTVPKTRTRPCPKCGAPAYQPCFTVRGRRILGEETDGAYQVPMAGHHPERKHPERAAADTSPPVAELAAPLHNQVAPHIRRWRVGHGVSMHVVGGCNDAALDMAATVPAADVPEKDRCRRPACRSRWPAGAETQ